MVRIHNVETDEIIDRVMTDSESAAYFANVQESRNELELQKQKINDKAALLQRLGISEDEAKLFLQ